MFKVKVKNRRGVGSSIDNVKTWLPMEDDIHLFKDWMHAKDFLRSVIETRSDIALKAGKKVEYYIGDDFGRLRTFGLDRDLKGPFIDLIECYIVAF